MTAGAVIAGRWVTPSLALGGRVIVVVAGVANAKCCIVVEIADNPIQYRVACRAVVGAGKMTTALAFGRRVVVVMAGIAAATDLVVVEAGPVPCFYRVATGTIV